MHRSLAHARVGALQRDAYRGQRGLEVDRAASHEVRLEEHAGVAERGILDVCGCSTVLAVRSDKEGGRRRRD